MKRKVTEAEVQAYLRLLESVMTNENKDSQLQLRLYKIAADALARPQPSLAPLAIRFAFVNNHLSRAEEVDLISAIHQLPP